MSFVLPSLSRTAQRVAQKTAVATALSAALLAAWQPAFAHDHELNGVVATIAPIQSLAQAVMGDQGEVALLIEGAQSPHGFSLKPSQRRMLNDADMVLYVSPTLESFLPSVLESLPESVEKIALISAPDIEHLPMREGGIWAEHNHDHGHGHDHDAHGEHEHAAEADGHDDHKDHAEAHEHEHASAEESGHDHDHEKEHEHNEAEAGHDHEAEHDHDHEIGDIDHLDPHIWLDPHNAIQIVKDIEHHLSEIYPDHAANFAENAASTIARLEDLDKDIATELSGVTGSFIVFHDAYQYFDIRYGLTAAGSISLNPEESPSVKRISELRERLKRDDVRCVFKEPQFRGKIIDTVVEGTDVKIIPLDPLGSAFEPNADLYPELIRSVADSFIDCLQ